MNSSQETRKHRKKHQKKPGNIEASLWSSTQSALTHSESKYVIHHQSNAFSQIIIIKNNCHCPNKVYQRITMPPPPSPPRPSFNDVVDGLVWPSNGSPSYAAVARLRYNAAAGAGEKRMLSPHKSKSTSTSPVKKKNNLGPSSPYNVSSVRDFNPNHDTGWRFNHTPSALSNYERHMAKSGRHTETLAGTNYLVLKARMSSSDFHMDAVSGRMSLERLKSQFSDGQGFSIQLYDSDKKLSFTWLPVIELAEDILFFGPPKDKVRIYSDIFRQRTTPAYLCQIYRGIAKETSSDERVNSSLSSNSKPLGGYWEAPHGNWPWIPILDGQNDWVQTGTRDRCTRYSNMTHDNKSPKWSTARYDNEDVTQNVICCLMSR